MRKPLSYEWKLAVVYAAMFTGWVGFFAQALYKGSRPLPPVGAARLDKSHENSPEGGIGKSPGHKDLAPQAGIEWTCHLK